jgi:hypothetical protein
MAGQEHVMDFASFLIQTLNSLQYGLLLFWWQAG